MKNIFNRLFQKLPVLTNFSKDWFLINYKILKDNGINSEIGTIMMFTYNSISGPLLLEYCGDFTNVKKLAKNNALLKDICLDRTDWYFRYLQPTYDIPLDTYTWLLWDKAGNIIGISACWDYQTFNPKGAFMGMAIAANVISKLVPQKRIVYNYDYKYIGKTIIFVYEKIEEKWVKTGVFDTELLFWEILKPTENTFSHLMRLFLMYKAKEIVNQKFVNI